jgi:hypothetical protein
VSSSALLEQEEVQEMRDAITMQVCDEYPCVDVAVDGAILAWDKKLIVVTTVADGNEDLQPATYVFAVISLSFSCIPRQCAT